jgi:metal-responsive CopG/Arc/MetJ family transcriptional regulator
MQTIPSILQDCNHLVSTDCMATQQVNVRMEDAFVEKLKEAAEQYHYRSHNEAARDLLETYFDLWCELQEAKQAFLKQQKGRLARSEKRIAG